MKQKEDAFKFDHQHQFKFNHQERLEWVWLVFVGRAK